MAPTIDTKESDERRAVETPPDLAETVRSLMVKLQVVLYTPTPDIQGSTR